MSNFAKVLQMQYKMKKITAAQVWAYVDVDRITEEEAVKICGPRPKE